MRTAHGFSSYARPSVMRSCPSSSDVTRSHTSRAVLSQVCSLSSLALPPPHLSFSPPLPHFLSCLPDSVFITAFYCAQPNPLCMAYSMRAALPACARGLTYLYTTISSSLARHLRVESSRSLYVQIALLLSFISLIHSFPPFLLKGALG